MRKTIFLLALLPLLPWLSARADGGDNLVVRTTTGETSSLLDNVRRIDFTQTGIAVVSKSDQTATYAFDDVTSIYFGSTVNAIESIRTGKTAGGKLLLYAPKDAGYVAVKGWTPGTAADVAIYTTTGAVTKKLKGWKGENIDITNLPKGVYIIKVGSKAAKFNR